ncbi:XRE family transcriptional regulator [Pseudomonas sp. PA27(2017)]|uniref:helix-turn-helix domain-containing protein n=1 Tax=Pseudomonas sp. PA27(2017) TaxID=1932112 RepID=UPI002114AE0A|nr:XRE family transcriptional regulator [Pseudomonas sp. PA27(2017)]
MEPPIGPNNEPEVHIKQELIVQTSSCDDEPMVQYSPTSNEAFSIRLKNAARAAGFSDWGMGARLASLTGVTPKAASKWLNAEAIPRRELAITIASALNIRVEWLLYGQGQQSQPGPTVSGPSVEFNDNVEEAQPEYKKVRTYPLISWIAAGNWAEACDNYMPGDGEDILESSANAGECGYWLTVRGDSMTSRSGFSFSEGTRILVQPEGFELISGKLYIAKLIDTGETTFKSYIRDAGVEYLKPLNDQYPPIRIDSNVQIIGRVIDAKAPPSAF